MDELDAKATTKNKQQYKTKNDNSDNTTPTMTGLGWR